MKSLMARTNDTLPTAKLTAMITDRKLSLFSEFQYTPLIDQPLESLLDFVFIEAFEYYINDPFGACNPFDDNYELQSEMRDALAKHGRHLGGYRDFFSLDERAASLARQVLASYPSARAA